MKLEFCIHYSKLLLYFFSLASGYNKTKGIETEEVSSVTFNFIVLTYDLISGAKKASV
jgi:hypothetical protein